MIPKEGMYYDPDTDMFVDYDEFRKYDDVSWMDKSQDTMEAKLVTNGYEQVWYSRCT